MENILIRFKYSFRECTYSSKDQERVVSFPIWQGADFKNCFCMEKFLQDFLLSETPIHTGLPMSFIHDLTENVLP